MVESGGVVVWWDAEIEAGTGGGAHLVACCSGLV